MTELATTGRVSSGVGASLLTGGAPPVSTAGATPSTAAAPVAEAAHPIWLDPADEARCTDCGTCYQELPQLFEQTMVLIAGQARQVARMIPGALDQIEVTPELQRRMDRVKATCDAEIIR
jgi:pyruvate-ferredoxin/flavodoxin oxidoreductase